MAEVVDKVPNPWQQYMDGQLWKLSWEEMAALPPSGWRPTQNYMADAAGATVGLAMIQWYVPSSDRSRQGQGVYYIRFFDPAVESDPAVLAGWKTL